MVYTSYWGNLKKLAEAGIEPIQISLVPPKYMSFRGRKILSLAPTWDMLKMPWDEYVERYEAILANNDAGEIIEFLGEGDVALLCFEKNPQECHRSLVAKWLVENGYECVEYEAPRKAPKAKAAKAMGVQLALL